MEQLYSTKLFNLWEFNNIATGKPAKERKTFLFYLIKFSYYLSRKKLEQSLNMSTMEPIVWLFTMGNGQVACLYVIQKFLFTLKQNWRNWMSTNGILH